MVFLHHKWLLKFQRGLFVGLVLVAAVDDDGRLQPPLRVGRDRSRKDTAVRHLIITPNNAESHFLFFQVALISRIVHLAGRVLHPAAQGGAIPLSSIPSHRVGRSGLGRRNTEVVA